MLWFFVKKLIWDEWNITHIGRHHVTPSEVEEVCHGDNITRSGYKNRIIVIGPTHTDRVLVIILDEEPEEGVYYPVTAWQASRKERKRYKNAKEVERNDNKN